MSTWQNFCFNKIMTPYISLNSSYRIANRRFRKYTQNIQNLYDKIPKLLFSGELIDVKILEEIISLLEKYDKDIEHFLNTIIESGDALANRFDLIQDFDRMDLTYRRETENILPSTRDFYMLFLICEMMDQGLMKTANMIITNSKLENKISIEKKLYTEMYSIYKALKNNQPQPCIDWCKKNKKYFRDKGSDFYVKIIAYCFIDLLKSGKSVEAIQFAKKNFSRPKDTHPDLIIKCVSLLAYKDIPKEELEHITSEISHSELIRRFPKEFKKAAGIKSQYSDFSILTQYGLIVLKTRVCDNSNYKVSCCPICNPTIQELVKDLPMINRHETHIWCPILRRFCTSSDSFVATPDGVVYTKEGMKILSKETDTFTCLSTRKVYSVDDVSKLYLSC